MEKVITVVYRAQHPSGMHEKVNVTEHEPPQLKAALEEGYVVRSITPTSADDGRVVTITFLLTR